MRRSAKNIMRSYETSLAPVFVVSRNTMRISLWSPGMALAAPMVVVNPVGSLLSELPFVNSADGYRLHRFLGRIFEAPAEHDHTRTFMLHLAAQNKRVLLEMVATYVLVTETEPTIIMTGHQVELDLAGLLACESVVSETTQDGAYEADGSVRFRSVSEAGSINGDNEPGAKEMDIARAAIAALESIDGTLDYVMDHDVGAACSTISSLTMPSLLDQAPNATMSTVSSLTTESANPSSLVDVQAHAHARARAREAADRFLGGFSGPHGQCETQTF